jgi:hypothetical protein
MGIEPTRHALTHLNGFEDRDNHQIAITSEIRHMSNKLESTATVY